MFTASRCTPDPGHPKTHSRIFGTGELGKGLWHQFSILDRVVLEDAKGAFEYLVEEHNCLKRISLQSTFGEAHCHKGFTILTGLVHGCVCGSIRVWPTKDRSCVTI
jgi:hypothetical protein